MMPGLVVQAFFFLRYYIQYGKRPLNVEGVVTSSITVGILMCIAAIAAFYFQRGLKKKFLARGLTLAGCFFVAGLFISGGRMVVASFIVLGTLAPFVCRSERLWRLQSIAVPGVMVVVLLAVLVGVVGGPKLRFDTDRSKDRTVERLYNIDQYEKDLRVRFVYWSAIAKEALKNPILGSGADRYEIGKVANTGFKLGSSHNALISALVVSGIPGVFLVFAFVFGCYRFLRSVLGQRNTIRAVGMTLWVGVTCMVFVALTNDLSAGRMFFWFTLMGMSGRYASICALECGVLKGTPVATTILEKPAG
jgi:O-antigen ligase